MTTKRPFWDVEEEKGFVEIKAWDKHNYKVWNAGTQESLQKVANILADVRRDMNKLLDHIWKVKNVANIQFEGKKITWVEHPIAFGIYHMFDIHMPNQDRYGYNYQEMTPNKHGILGLNKPKIIVTKQFVYEGNIINYEIAEKRSMFLTIRPKLSGNIGNGDPNYFDSYKTIMDLVLHEITHTTCNDVRWKKDNHLHPFHKYESLIKQWAKECGIKK